MTRAPSAASLNVTVTGTTAVCSGAGCAATALGRTAMIGVPRTTWLCADHAPENTDWVASGPPSAGVTSTASVMMPESRRTAARAATSLPSGPEVTSTAAGADCRTAATSASTLGSTR